MHVYFINLDSRADRRSQMEAQFETLGVAATRIPAVTPDAVTEDLREKYCDPHNWHWMRVPELCCSLSHIKALETFLSTDETHALVLEDDAKLSASLPDFLKQYKAQAAPYDVLRVETYLDRQRLAPQSEPSIGTVAVRQSWSWCAGTAAYIVTRNAARHILESGEFLRLQTDGALFNPYERLSRKLAIRHCVPGLAVQMDRLDPTQRDSDIQQGRKPLPISLVQRIYRTVGGIAKTELLWGAQRQFHTVFGGARKVFVPFRAD